jgi:3',5'-cyclic AMP phosphodiesterase CpdA
MPFHLSRRRFLATSAASSLVFASVSRGAGAEGPPDRLALLSDTHIAADPEFVVRETHLANNLRQAMKQVAQLADKPAALLLHGDAAYLKGEIKDYETLGKLLKPAVEANLPLHILMGNHDNRDNFAEMFGKLAKTSLLESRQVAVVEGQHANWFLLDSLVKTNSTPGLLGEQQLAWLAKALDERASKPAIISVHHNPQWKVDEKTKIGGIQDTEGLFAALESRKQVKAVFFGHTHAWSVKERGGIHLVNLPPVAYPFNKTAPSGWVEAVVGTTGMQLTLHALAEKHPQQGEKHTLLWRT